MFSVQKIIFLFSFLNIACQGLSQNIDFTTLSVHSKDSKSLINSCKELNNEALERISNLTPDYYYEVKTIYSKRLKFLVEKVESGSFFKDDELQNLVNSIKNKIEKNNLLKIEKDKYSLRKVPA